MALRTLTYTQHLAGRYWSIADPIGHPIDEIMKDPAIGHSKTTATFVDPDNNDPALQIRISGSNLKFDTNGRLKSGTITGITYLDHDAVALEVTGLALNAANARVAYNQDQYYPIDPNPVYHFDASSVATPGEENLGVTFASWSGNDKITGSNFDDYLQGITGNDTIKGLGGNDSIDGGNDNDNLQGGGGIDTLSGNFGNDTLNGGGGRDWALIAPYTSTTNPITVNLATGKATSAAYGNDKLISIESAYGFDGNDKLTGNGDANSFIANKGADSLDGAGGRDKLFGGEGHDTMKGGAGADFFVFYPGAANSDHVTDFQPGADTIVLHTVAFISIAEGVLTDDHFVTGKNAKDADDFVIYNKKTGQLFYDFDGTGSGAKQLLATFDNKPVIHASDVQGIHLDTDFWL